MNIRRAEFLVSAAKPPEYPRGGLPEVAFLGRSNVGKSSLINTLLNRRRLAQTSRTPGKTRRINFFSVNSGFLFVDLPGYGYARVSRSVHASWEKMVESYLSARTELCGSILLVDLRHPPTPQDLQMKSWLDHRRLAVIVVGTKADKFSSSRRELHLRQVREGLALKEEDPVIPFSSRTGLGKDRVWSALEKLLP